MAKVFKYLGLETMVKQVEMPDVVEYKIPISGEEDHDSLAATDKTKRIVDGKLIIDYKGSISEKEFKKWIKKMRKYLIKFDELSVDGNTDLKYIAAFSKKISKDDISEGDVIYFDTENEKSKRHRIAKVEQNGKFVEAEYKVPVQLETDLETGLNSTDVEDRRKRFGENRIPEKPLKKWSFFAKEVFSDDINKILLGMLVVLTIFSFAGYVSLTEPAAIAVVLLIITGLAVNNGLKLQRASKKLRDQTSTHYANVMRDGKVLHINKNEIVVGDVILIESGEGVYAEGFLAEGKVGVDNSVLNGEARENKKKPFQGLIFETREEYDSDDYELVEHMFCGTSILSGRGTMIATKVGEDTENGKTLMMVGEIEEPKTALEIKIEDLAKQISVFGFVAAAAIIVLTIASQYVHGQAITIISVIDVVITAFTIIIAAVPEGLGLIIQSISYANAKKMLADNIMVKRQKKIPEAGNIDLLCSDKTGTLTRGILTITNVLDPNGNVVTDLRAYKLNAILNATGRYDAEGNIVGGNVTEHAFLESVTPEEFERIREENVVEDDKPFNSAWKYSAVRVNGRTYFKGAPDILISHCTNVDEGKIMEIIRKYTTQGMRVLAMAESTSPIGDELTDDLELTYIITISDDVREGVTDVVKATQDAGIQVMMVTGDVIETAKSIATKCGILKDENDVAMNAKMFDSLSDEEAKAVLPNLKVVARATPKTKLRIVSLAQQQGRCVGMTGDGTNDSPALKKADVGFSMGSGSDVCKDAGDLIITDDSFISIIKAIHYGRTFMHNVKKFLKFQLPINVGLVILCALMPLVWMVEAFASVQILVINIVMDTLNSLSFAGEPAKAEYMLEKPESKKAKLLDGSTVKQVALSTVALVGLILVTAIPAVRVYFETDMQWQAARFAIITIGATINGFNIRTDKFNLFENISQNPNFLKVACIIFAGTFFIVNCTGTFFKCQALNPMQWAIVVGLSICVIPIDMIRKLIIKVSTR